MRWKTISFEAARYKAAFFCAFCRYLIKVIVYCPQQRGHTGNGTIMNPRRQFSALILALTISGVCRSGAGSVPSGALRAVRGMRTLRC